MDCLKKFFNDFNIEELKGNAEKALAYTGEKAKCAACTAKKEYDELDSDTKNAIMIGATVFVIVIAIAGIFYFIGKKAGRNEAAQIEYEEWDC